MKTPITPQGLPPYIYGWEAGPNEKVWNEAAVRAALAAQAATLESIHKILQCAGPDAAGEIADLLGYPSVEWPSDQAASAEPVAYRVDWPVEAGLGLPRFFGADDRDRMDNWVRDRECTVHPLVYAGAPHAHIPADVEALRSAVFTVLEGFTLHHDVRKILEKAYYAPSPAQAVDAVDEQLAGELKSYTDDDSMFLTVNVPKVLLLRAAKALQASRQPQTQQGGGENTARAFIEWCKAQPEDRVPVSIDEAMNEFEAALATKEPK